MTSENGGMRTRGAWWEALSLRLRTPSDGASEADRADAAETWTAMTRLDSPLTFSVKGW